MNNKKTVFIGIIGVVIACVVLLVILLLSQLGQPTTNSNGNNPISNPVSGNVNIIDLNNPIGGAFEIAVIRPDDTIELRNKINEKFIIGLEKRNWKSLSWSPDGKLVSALGETLSGIYDLYIYNLNRKEWNKVTDYKNFSSGVDQYVWVDNNTILFTQGQAPTRWIHRYNYVSKETLKVSNVVGDIVSNSPDKKSIIVKATGAIPEIYNSAGNKINMFDTLADIETNDPLAFEEIQFFNNSTKILGLTTHSQYYKFNVGDVAAVKTSLSSDFKLLCSLSENSFFAYKVEGNNLTLGSFSSKDDTLNILVEQSFKTQFNVNRELSYCVNNNLYLKMEFADQTTQWYKLNNTELEQDMVLDGNLDTDIMSK